MAKLYEFQCWNCPEVYLLSLEITDEQEIIVVCPFCEAEAVVDWRPYYKRLRTVLKGDDDNEMQSEEGFQFPEILPTKEPGKPS